MATKRRANPLKVLTERFDAFEADTKRQFKSLRSSHSKHLKRTGGLEKAIASITKALDENTRVTRETNENTTKTLDLVIEMGNAYDAARKLDAAAAALDTPVPSSEDTVVRTTVAVVASSETLPGH